jgi:hypothetical protein
MVMLCRPLHPFVIATCRRSGHGCGVAAASSGAHRRPDWQPADSHAAAAFNTRGRNRTCDLSFRKAPLYPLSYAGDAD